MSPNTITLPNTDTPANRLPYHLLPEGALTSRGTDHPGETDTNTSRVQAYSTCTIRSILGGRRPHRTRSTANSRPTRGQRAATTRWSLAQAANGDSGQGLGSWYLPASPPLARRP